MLAAGTLRRTLVLLGALSLLAPFEASVVGAAETAPAASKAAPAKKAAPKKKAAAKNPVPAMEAIKEIMEGEDVRGFREFCDTWMGKLRDRTTFNTANVAWKKAGAGVVGEYVSYGTDRTCIAREEPGKDPIGKITYREVLYRKEGPTEQAAMAGAGTIVEQTDVTEIFRFAKGRWQY